MLSYLQNVTRVCLCRTISACRGVSSRVTLVQGRPPLIRISARPAHLLEQAPPEQPVVSPRWRHLAVPLLPGGFTRRPPVAALLLPWGAPLGRFWSGRGTRAGASTAGEVAWQGTRPPLGPGSPWGLGCRPLVASRLAGRRV